MNLLRDKVFKALEDRRKQILRRIAQSWVSVDQSQVEWAHEYKAFQEELLLVLWKQERAVIALRAM